MDFKASLPIAIGFLFPATPALASPVRTVYSSQAEGINSPLIQLKVGPGGGVNINLPDGETIKKVWLDDQSRIGLSSDGNLCPWTAASNQKPDCVESEAAMLHLRQIKQINFPSLPHSPDGGTLLTVRVQGTYGRKTYLFKIVPVNGLSDFVNLDILPDAPTRAAVVPEPLLFPEASPRVASGGGQGGQGGMERISSPSPPSPLSPSSPPPPSPSAGSIQPPSNDQTNDATSTTDASVVAPVDTSVEAETLHYNSLHNADAMAFGLLVAKKTGRIKPTTIGYQKFQSAIVRLLQGETATDAAHNAGLQLSEFNQMLTWGEKAIVALRQGKTIADVAADVVQNY